MRIDLDFCTFAQEELTRMRERQRSVSRDRIHFGGVVMSQDMAADRDWLITRGIGQEVTTTSQPTSPELHLIYAVLIRAGLGGP